MIYKDSDEKTPIEHDIKEFFLHNKYLFNDDLGDLGENRIVFEKNIGNQKVRADALVFTELKGIIGVEFKTQNDTLKRLPRQLKQYIRTCNYVYVFCDDSHALFVEDIIKKLGYSCVGIISYTVYEDLIIAGVYRKAKKNPNYSLYTACHLFWKSELHFILRTLTNKPIDLIKNTFQTEYINTVQELTKNPQTEHLMQSRLAEGFSTAYGSNNLTYKQLISNFVGLLGEKVGTQVLCESFIYHEYSPEHYLKLYDFSDHYGKYGEQK